MKNRGFTLIELLAVVILLSLLALFTIPKILEQKENKEKQISEAEKQVLYTDAGTYIRENNSEDITPGQVFCVNVDTLIDEDYISMDAEDFKNDTIKVTVDKNNNFVYAIDNNCTGSVQINNNYKEQILNGAIPVLNRDMIPVTIDNDGTVKKANIKEEWYKYADKKWANAVVLTDNTKYDTGDTIPEDKIKAYYVWIPRYSYKLFNSTSPIEIQIEFETNKTPKKRETEVNKYYTHPAFTYGNKELNGFWVGKFETTGTSSAPTIKPNISPQGNQGVSTQYTISLKLSRNSRMMKNDEWGAVAYLSHSKYGTNKQIRINNGNYITGCGASEDDKAYSSGECDIAYGQSTSYPQSTTGNITGIFDMAGGSVEYVMAVRTNSEGDPLSGSSITYNSGFNGKFGSPGSGEATELTTGIDFPDSKNYNLYDNPNDRSNTTGDNGCNGEKCYGHALTETKNWYGDYYRFVTNWLLRGGDRGSGASSGIFTLDYTQGSGYKNRSFRTVSTP